MKKIKLGLGGALMLSAMLISDKTSVFAVYIFASILHEFGHLIAARALKIKIKEIKLGFSGVRIVVDEEITAYSDEILLSLSGPAVNLVCMIFCFAFCGYMGIGKEELFGSAEVFFSNGNFELKGVIGFFAVSSFVQAFTNLLPIKSFDGGRALECLISWFLGVGFAERLLTVTTLFSAFMLWTVGLYLMLKISSGLGIYIFALCVFALCLEKTNFNK